MLETLVIVHIPSEDEKQETCKFASLTRDEYDEILAEAYDRESATMFDMLGYKTQRRDNGKIWQFAQIGNGIIIPYQVDKHA